MECCAPAWLGLKYRTLDTQSRPLFIFRDVYGFGRQNKPQNMASNYLPFNDSNSGNGTITVRLNLGIWARGAGINDFVHSL